jgi:hypothetical protein
MAAFGLRPSLSAEPVVALDPSDPYSIAFSITNGSVLSIPLATAWCQEQHVEFDNGESFEELGKVGTHYYRAENISPSDKVTVICPQLAWSWKDPADSRVRELYLGGPPPDKKTSPVKSATIVLHFQYRYYVPSKLFRRQFLFDGLRGKDGNFHWFQEPATR